MGRSKMSIALVALFSILSFGDFSHSTETLSAFDSAVYQRILSHCQSEDQNLQHSLAMVETMKTTYTSIERLITEFDATPIEVEIRNGGLSPTMSSILHSDGLYQGLKVCFGSDETRANRFVLKMIVADVIGTGIGAIQGTVVYLGVGSVALLGRAYKIFKLTRWGRTLNSKKIVKLATIGSGTLLGLGTIYYLVSKYKNEQVEKENLQAEELKQATVLAELVQQFTLRAATLNSLKAPLRCQRETEMIEIRLLFNDIYNDATSTNKQNFSGAIRELQTSSHNRCQAN